MPNLRMHEKVEKHLCIDVSRCQRTDDGSYVLPKFVEDVDYCVLETERWIWSIGQHNISGRIFASTDARFYGDPSFRCLWLR